MIVLSIRNGTGMDVPQNYNYHLRRNITNLTLQAKIMFILPFPHIPLLLDVVYIHISEIVDDVSRPTCAARHVITH